MNEYSHPDIGLGKKQKNRYERSANRAGVVLEICTVPVFLGRYTVISKILN
jgi:hypothetical protein